MINKYVVVTPLKVRRACDYPSEVGGGREGAHGKRRMFVDVWWMRGATKSKLLNREVVVSDV